MAWLVGPVVAPRPGGARWGEDGGTWLCRKVPQREWGLPQVKCIGGCPWPRLPEERRTRTLVGELLRVALGFRWGPVFKKTPVWLLVMQVVPKQPLLGCRRRLSSLRWKAQLLPPGCLVERPFRCLWVWPRRSEPRRAQTPGPASRRIGEKAAPRSLEDLSRGR